MNFGLIEALEKALLKPAEELSRNFNRTTSLLEDIRAEQQRTNNLLGELVRQGKDLPLVKPQQLPRTKAGKVSTQ